MMFTGRAPMDVAIALDCAMMPVESASSAVKSSRVALLLGRIVLSPTPDVMNFISKSRWRLRPSHLATSGAAAASMLRPAARNSISFFVNPTAWRMKSTWHE